MFCKGYVTFPLTLNIDYKRKMVKQVIQNSLYNIMI